MARMVDILAEADGHQTKVTATSGISNKEHSIILPMPMLVFEHCMYMWQNGTMIQEAFPMLNAEQREFLMTGITSEEWSKLYPED